MALKFLNNGYFAGKVGIGTNSPGGNLDIKAGMGSSGQFNGAQLRLLSTDTVDTTGFQGIRFATSTADYYGWTMGANRSNNGRGSLRFFEHTGNSSGAERFTIKQDGNVGIGTSSPSEKLEVAGSVGSFKTTGHQIFLTRNGNNEIYAVGASSVLALGQNGSEKMRINSGGNVGIGTTSPGTINGVAFSSVGLHTKFGTLGRTITEGTQRGEYIMNHSGETANRRAKFIQSKAGDINIGSYDDNGTERLHARLDNNGTFFLGNASTAYQTVFFDSTPGTVYGNGTLQISPLTSPGSGIAQFTTNFADRVGSGTTKHNVRVGGTVTATDFIGGSGAYLPLSAGSGSPLTSGLYIPSYIYHVNDSNTLFGFGGQDLFIINTGGGRRLTVTNTEATFENNLIVDGNVGIGTNSPSTQLEISKDSDDGTNAPIFSITNASTTLNDGADIGTIQFKNSDLSSGGPHVATIKGIANSSDERTAELAFSTGSIATTSEAMRIDSTATLV